MDIIITCGYMGSGSSAVTDLLGEYGCLYNSTASFEYVFMHCPNGVFDLEDKLLYGNNVIISDYAIKEFRNQMNKLYYTRFWWVGNYKKIFGKRFLENVDDYLKSITQFKYDGGWYYHEAPSEFEDKLRYLKHGLRRMTKGFVKLEDKLKYNEMEVSFIDANNFYEQTSKFVENNLNLLYKGDKTIVLDQLFLPHNLYRLEKYFSNNAKAIVVERDPRDVFIINKYYWSKTIGSVPFPYDVNMFCEYYKKIRSNERIIDKNILRLKFENLVLEYDLSISQIGEFLKINENQHVFYKEKFNPDLSVANLMVFSNSRDFYEEVKIIENKLEEYLFDFSKYKEQIRNSKGQKKVF